MKLYLAQRVLMVGGDQVLDPQAVKPLTFLVKEGEK